MTTLFDDKDKYRVRLEKDVESPRCKDYVILPISRLAEPALGEDCWLLYIERKYSENDSVPYDISIYDAKMAGERRKEFFVSAGLMSALVLIVSGSVYYFALLIVSIMRWFRVPRN